MHSIKRHLFAGLVLMSLALGANAGMPSEPNPCGNHGNNCNTDPDPTPTTSTQTQSNDQTQGQLQGQGQVATGGNGLGLGVGYGAGGDGGSASAGSASNSGAAATGGDAASDARSNSTSGSASLSGASNDTRIGDVGSTSGASSNSGNNRLNNDSNSTSGAYSGGNSVTGINAASTDGSGNSSVTVDAANRSTYTSQSLWIPDIQTAAPALVASPTLVIERGVCGPRHEKRSTSVDGTYVGLFKRSRLDLGVEDEVVPAAEPYRYWKDPQGVTHVFGHQLITAFSVNGVAASRAVGLGGGKTGGDWGQAGVSSGSSVQRTIVRVQIVECELPVQQAAPQDTYFEPAVNG